jgi:t-SNARE complex subunit (syntaxin)
MTDKNHLPLGRRSKKTHRLDTFVETGADQERQVTKTFRIPESLGRRLKVHAAQTGQKEKTILVNLITGYLVDKGA